MSLIEKVKIFLGLGPVVADPTAPVVVIEAISEMEAQQVVAYLSEHGIKAQALMDFSPIIGADNTVNGSRVIVGPDDAETAKQLLEQEQ